MTAWAHVIEAWGASLDAMDVALEAGDWAAAADAVWTPPARPPASPPDATERLQLADLDRRSGHAARRITQAMATIGDELVDAARRRGAARAYHARMG